MKYVAYDVLRSYPLLPENDVWGEAKNTATGKCIDTLGNPVPGAGECSPIHETLLFKLERQLAMDMEEIKSFG